MEPLHPGRIIWHVAPGDRGSGKTRPMVVTTRRIDIVRGKPIVAVVCSTHFREPPEPNEILIPSDPEGAVVTRLREKTVAVCDWLVTLQSDEIKETGGMVHSALLREICSKAAIPLPFER